LNSNGKSTLEELEWASDYLSEKIEKVSLLIENLCKQIEHVSDKKDKKKIKNIEKLFGKQNKLETPSSNSKARF
jgi:thiaminase